MTVKFSLVNSLMSDKICRSQMQLHGYSRLLESHLSPIQKCCAKCDSYLSPLITTLTLCTTRKLRHELLTLVTVAWYKFEVLHLVWDSWLWTKQASTLFHCIEIKLFFIELFDDKIWTAETDFFLSSQRNCKLGEIWLDDFMK